MSTAGVRWALDQEVTPPGAKFVLVVLAWKADRDGCAWPSQATLAAACSMSVRAVQYHLAELEAAKLIEKLDRERRPDGKLGGLRYRLLITDATRRSTLPVAPGEVERKNQATPVSPQLLNNRDRQLGTAEKRPQPPLWITGAPMSDAEVAEGQARIRELSKRFRTERGDNTRQATKQEEI